MRHMHSVDRPICELASAVELIDSMTRSIFGTVDCPNCLRQGIAESEERARVLRELLAKVGMPMSPHYDRTKAAGYGAGHTHSVLDGQLCLQSHYAVIVEAHKDVEIYLNGDADCPSCLRRMAEKHEELAKVFRSRLAEQPTTDRGSVVKRCRVYDALCINPIYCDARDACCAGDPDCKEVP